MAQGGGVLGWRWVWFPGQRRWSQQWPPPWTRLLCWRPTPASSPPSGQAASPYSPGQSCSAPLEVGECVFPIWLLPFFENEHNVVCNPSNITLKYNNIWVEIISIYISIRPWEGFILEGGILAGKSNLSDQTTPRLLAFSWTGVIYFGRYFKTPRGFYVGGGSVFVLYLVGLHLGWFTYVYGKD